MAKSQKDADLKALVRLLSPSGALFMAINTVDADGSTKFHFPRQRLPTHTQMLLASDAGIKQLSTWPQYTGLVDATAVTLKGHVHVDVFQYFCYWFAFYAIKGVDSGSSDAFVRSASSQPGSGFGTSVRRAADALHLTRGRDSDATLRYPFIYLLRILLADFVPSPAAGSLRDPSLYSTTSDALELSLGHGASAAASLRGKPIRFSISTTKTISSKRSSNPLPRGLIFFSTLIEFWLKDADEPVPPQTSDTLQKTAATSLIPLWGTTYEPPAEDLLEAIREIIKHATVAMKRENRAFKPYPAQAGAPWLPVCPVMATVNSGFPPAGPPQLYSSAHVSAQLFGRQLYRMFHRAFTMWPDQRSMKPLLKVFLAYVAPWEATTASTHGLASRIPTKNGEPKVSDAVSHATPATGAIASHLTAQMTELASRVRTGRGTEGEDHFSTHGSATSSSKNKYSSEWEIHVLSNLPFYLDLFPLFLERSISRISIRGESAVDDVLKVLGMLEASPELLELLRGIEQEMNKAVISHGRRMDGAYSDIVPWLLEQIEDWQRFAEATALIDNSGTAASARGGASRGTMLPVLTASNGKNGGRPIYSMFSVSDRCAAGTAREIIDISSGILKSPQLRRFRQCMERVLPLASLAEARPHLSPGKITMEDQGGAGFTRLPRSTWKDVKYKGDPMFRPIASFEIGFLVRFLVFCSSRINHILKLDQGPPAPGELPPENRFQEGIVWLRRREFRINMRPAADVRNLFWVPFLWWMSMIILRIAWYVIRALLMARVESDDDVQ